MTSAQQTSLSSAHAANRPKHRACDECRTRKLACTKEADGCRRCKREGIACVYSAQKQMGRPRKRRAADPAADRAPVSNTTPNTATPAAAPTTSTQSAPGDVGLAFLNDQSSPGVSFFDFLGLGEMDLAPMSSSATPVVLAEPDPDIAQQPLPSPKRGPFNVKTPFPPQSPWSVPLSDIDFSTSSSTRDTPSGGLSSSKQTLTPPYDVDATAEPPLTSTAACSSMTPSTATPPNTLTLPPHSHSCCGRWPGAGGSGDAAGGGDDDAAGGGGAPDGKTLLPGACVIAAPSKVCSCLARMYLALDSLQDLPTEIATAITVARNAAHAAHDTMVCPSCSPPHFNDIHFTPPLQSFQNLMILSALLPSIAHAYRRIVDMVDAEAARATAAHEKLSVGLKQYGGVWGRLARWDSLCASATNLEGSMVEPPLWRLAMRALLKVDVYGVHVEKSEATCEVSPATAARWGLGDGVHSFKVSGATLDVRDRTAAAAANGGEGDGSGSAAASSSSCKGCDTARVTGTPPTSTNTNMTSVHIGLKDIVEMMEARAKFRHDCLDAAADAGLLENAETKGYVRLPPGEKHNCQKVIDIARKEIDKLVIV